MLSLSSRRLFTCSSRDRISRSVSAGFSGSLSSTRIAASRRPERERISPSVLGQKAQKEERSAGQCAGISRRAGERVMESLTRFIKSKLKLQVNQQKNAVARPWARKFLGFSFTSAGAPKRRIAPKAVDRFKERIRELTNRNRGVSIERMAEELSLYLRGWIGYFGKCETPSVLAGLEQWLRRRLRSAIWKQWKRGPARFAELRRWDVRADLAAQTAASAHGPWRLADSPALSIALPNAYFDSLGIPRLTVKPIA
ncbi:MAG: hypothetical protein K2X03_15745 [Bryobacteraceae bacterium]|nr:hypothetical protein [Bryobacteraceae bacterium]